MITSTPDFSLSLSKWSWAGCFTCLVLIVCFMAVSGCVVEERLVPHKGPIASWQKVATADKIIKRGMSKDQVRRILGPPVSMGPDYWHYRVYGKKIAEAHITFDEKQRVLLIKSFLSRPSR